MKYTTRTILATTLFNFIVAAVAMRNLYIFIYMIFPVALGWVIGELLNIPLPRVKWRGYRNDK